MKINTISIIKKIQTQIFIVYILLIFEGALRKWVFPQLSSPLFFIKDPFVLYIYYLCWKYKLFPQNKVAKFTYYLSLLFFVFGFFQTLLNNFPFVVVIYGWRNYFMYAPLGFIIAEYCDLEFLKKMAAFTCYVSIPIAVLTFIQYKSPADAYVNRNVGGSTTIVFTVSRGIVRTSGTFSFTNGQAFFIASLLMMLLINYFAGKKHKFLPDIISYIASLAFLSNLAVSGSRSAYGASASVVALLIFSSLLLINKKKSASIILFSIVGGIITIIAFNTIFTDQLELLAERNSIANDSEGSPIIRFLNTFIITTVEDIPFWGYGLGIGSIGGTFLATGTNSFGLAESEWARIELENGYFMGLLYVAYKIYLSYMILKDSFWATLSSGNPIPMIVVGFIFLTVFIGQMTMNGTTMGYGWIFIGYSIAINRIYLHKEYEQEEKIKVIAT